MTGGTTPGGLRYPGPDDPVSNIPTYIKNLADDITAKLGSAGSGWIFASYTGGVSTNGNGYATLSVPTIRDVKGGFALPGNNNAFIYQMYPPWIAAHPEDFQQKVLFWVAQPQLAPGDANYPVKNRSGVAMSMLCWGTPWNP